MLRPVRRKNGDFSAPDARLIGRESGKTEGGDSSLRRTHRKGVEDRFYLVLAV